MSIICFALVLASCSFNDSKKEAVVEQSDDLEFSVDSLAEVPSVEIQSEEEKASEVVIPDKFKAPVVAEHEEMEKPVEPNFNDFKKEEKTLEAPAKIVMREPVEVAKVASNNAVKIGKKAKQKVVSQVEIFKDETKSSDNVQMTKGIEKYRVQKGDTLMMVAFKIYGDYEKWRDIKKLNPNVEKLTEGVELKYHVPFEKFGWEPVGDPYLVKNGDTLGIISMDKYGTPKKWKAIYENNRPLIKNPNLIFAGFTLYYRPLRDLASEPK